ncbi:MAG: cation:proton antiporter [Chitinispirillia bacterium]|jgi:Kef-type K+ transport system membrane component KefB
MKFLFAILSISIIAIVGSRVTFYKRRLPLGFRHILLVGTEYIFIGVIFGQMGFNFIDDQAVKLLEPVLLFGLGWIGFLFGLQFDIKQLKALPRYYFTITAIQAFITFTIVFFPMFFLLKFFLKDTNIHLFSAALTLASTACCTAQSALAIVSRAYNFKNRGLSELLRYISSVDGLFGILFFSVALSIIPGMKESGFEWLVSFKWLALSITMGVVSALILFLLTNRRLSQDELLLFLMGTVLFCAGLAHRIHNSPLVSGLICGILFANFSHHRIRALTIVINAEKSIYIMLLLLLGAGWSFKPDFSLILMAAYFLVRLAGKIVGSFLAIKSFTPKYNVPQYLGLGLIPEGGLAIAIMVNFKLHPVIGIEDVMTTIIVLSVLISELLGPSFIVKLFKDGE